MTSRQVLNITPLLLSVGAVLSFTLATLVYTGGTAFNAAEPYYLWHLNTISETMMTSGYMGQDLTMSRVFGTIAVLLMLSAVGSWLYRTQQNTSGRVVTVVALTFLTLPILLPADIFTAPHNLAFALGVLLATIAVAIARAHAKQAGITQNALSLLLFILCAYVTFLMLFPSPTASETVRIFHATSQKLLVATLLAASTVSISTKHRAEHS